MPSRGYNSPDYRYGFNGKEKDDEVKGSGNQQDYGERMYMPPLGRFPSPDPLIVEGQEYPELSPYQFASNTPIDAIDLDGLERIDYRMPWGEGGGGRGGGCIYTRNTSKLQMAQGQSAQNAADLGRMTYDHANGGFGGRSTVETNSRSSRYALRPTFSDDDISTTPRVEPKNTSTAKSAGTNSTTTASKTSNAKTISAKSATQYQALKADLAKQELGSIFTKDGYVKPEIIAKSEIAIQGGKLQNQALKNALTADGSKITDWSKMSYTVKQQTNMVNPKSGQIENKDYDIHYYYNSVTKKTYYEYDFKVKLNENVIKTTSGQTVPTEVKVGETR